MFIRSQENIRAIALLRIPRRRWVRAIALLCWAGLTGTVTIPHAASASMVTLNTSSLAGAGGRFEFLLLDGDGVANNSVTISNIVSNGTFIGTECSVGCTGGPTSFVIDDSLGFGQFLYDLTLGSSLTFSLSYTTNFSGVPGTDPPDRFALSLLDPDTNFSLIRTDLLFPSDALQTIDLIGSGVVQTARSTSPSIGISIDGGAVLPEPAPLALTAIALVALFRRQGLQALRACRLA
jgi:hypothetical protein